MTEGWNATQRELEILELRKENERLKTALGRGVTHQQKGTSWVMLRRLDCFNPMPSERDDALPAISSNK